MTNLKHGFYSNNTAINPDSILINNADIKRRLIGHTGNIKLFLSGACDPNLNMEMHYLISCALPDSPHLLPKTHLERAIKYSQSDEFQTMEALISMWHK